MKKLFRSRKNRLVGGLLGGVGEYLNVDPSVVRLIFLILLIMTQIIPMTILYFVSFLVIPSNNDDYNHDD